MVGLKAMTGNSHTEEKYGGKHQLYSDCLIICTFIKPQFNHSKPKVKLYKYSLTLSVYITVAVIYTIMNTFVNVGVYDYEIFSKSFVV